MRTPKPLSLYALWLLPLAASVLLISSACDPVEPIDWINETEQNLRVYPLGREQDQSAFALKARETKRNYLYINTVVGMRGADVPIPVEAVNDSGETIFCRLMSRRQLESKNLTVHVRAERTC